MRLGRVILSLIICFSFQFAKAQLKDTFEKGTIITKDDVEMNGFIKINDLSHLSSEICFKQTEKDAKYITYNTTQIKSFQTASGKFFDLFSIMINNNTAEITVFANLILKGETSLYKTIYKSQTFYIVVTKNKNYVLQNDELVTGETETRRNYFQGVLNSATDGFLMSKYSKIAFEESEFVKIISEYNASKGYESKDVSYKEKNVYYPIVFISAAGKNRLGTLFQGFYRIYYPKLSRSTSLNIGLQYYNTHYSILDDNEIRKIKGSLVSVPFQFQQNILQKNIRPYIFGGFNLAYVNVVDDKGNSYVDKGFQRNFGIGILYGAGLEIDVYKGIMLKSEWRNELFTSFITLGVGYNFSK